MTGPDLSSVTDEELVEALEDMFHAQELREWMSANELERKRGANKRESARQAVEADRDGVALFLHERGAIEAGGESLCEHHEACGNETPSHRVSVCDECMDVTRTNSSRGGVVDLDDFDSEIEYIRALHERFG